MIWQNPWAWMGLLTLGVPVLIHLLSRRRADVQRFPTLRFMEASRLTPTRSTRLNDLLLLAVRLGILATAVAALAQPVWLTASRKRQLGSELARAVVVDTSASMARLTPAGERAIDVARREARNVAGDARASVVLESAAPARALAGALAWLATQAGKRELIILSDFQIGTIDQASLAVVPPEVGIQLKRIDVQQNPGALEMRSQAGDVETVARITLTPDRTDVDWTTDRNATTRAGDDMVVLAGPSERAGAEAAERAARLVAGQPPAAAGRTVAIVYPGFEQRAQLMRDAKTLNQPWMADVVARLRRDSTLVAAASTVEAGGDTSVDLTRFIVVARTDAGRPVAVATSGNVQGHDRLLLFSMADAGSLASAALIVAATRSVSSAPPVTEIEPASLSDAVLHGWQRPASPGAPRVGDAPGVSDGRWFWVLALVLLIIETWIRRRSSASDRDPESAHDRPL